MSRLKTVVVLLVLAGVLAAGVAGWHEPEPVEQRLIGIQASETLPGVADIQQLPVDLQAALLDLSDDPLVSLKAQATVVRYPDMAAQVFPLYASEPQFREILRRHGEAVLPPVVYFIDNPVATVEAMNALSRQYDRLKALVERFQPSGDEPVVPAPPQPDPAAQELTPDQRGWYAVNFIDAEGHGFLGQFEVAEDGSVHWIQTERITEGVTEFFTSGIRTLETRQRTGEEIRLSDIGWASVDVLIFASAVKVLRAGRAAVTATRGAGFSTRSAALAARVTGAGRLVLRSARYARWPLVIGAGYLVIRHPVIISDLLAEVARVADLPVWLVQWAGWALILLPVLFVIRWLMWPLALLLRALVPVLLWLAGRMRTAGGVRERSW